ncbi:dienelactone hydrolase family protein [Dictyobacter kobayashii]|uniref:DeoR family transcriptional regulator n=1 Tax=Dictyobacter kobayashii TaxID=2014872 RepID=A0A402AKZ5_9CHLR|nr:dienelactone hydrolase family protein [Dictyobacter kobayashii]GCE19796.1 DeoR family transcriptional regulator [Dictyobacter kobayashii]
MIERNDENYRSTANPQGQLVRIGAEAVDLNGILHVPQDARGLIILAHGIEDSQKNPHQNVIALASAFQQHGLATLQVDLFSSDELALDERTAFFRQNIDIMQQRIVGTAEWFLENPSTDNLSIGYFGMNEVGAAAIAAAASRPDVVAAVVAVGDAGDFGLDYAPRVLAPTLLLAAEGDQEAVDHHRRLLEGLQAEKQLEIVPGEASLFENQHAFDEVARLVGGWFSHWLVPIV